MSDSFNLVISDRMLAAAVMLRGAEGAAEWFGDIPGRIDEACNRWALKPVSVADEGAMSCCVYAINSEGKQVVLKIPYDRKSGVIEAAALTKWALHAASPKVIAVDSNSGEFLMERVLPGSTAFPVGVFEDSVQFADLLRRLHVKDTQAPTGTVGFTELLNMRFDWAFNRFLKADNTAALNLTEAARIEANKLLENPAEDYFLHGDMAPKNILVGADGEWLVIDPFACVGDRHTDVAYWAVSQNSSTTIAERIAEITRLTDLDETKLTAWSQIFSIAELRPALPDYANRMIRFLNESGPLWGFSTDVFKDLVNSLQDYT